MTPRRLLAFLVPLAFIVVGTAMFSIPVALIVMGLLLAAIELLYFIEV